MYVALLETFTGGSSDAELNSPWTFMGYSSRSVGVSECVRDGGGEGGREERRGGGGKEGGSTCSSLYI